MSRTDIPPAILAWSLRRMAGDGSMEWVHEPIQASVLLDVADMLDESAKLRERVAKARDPQRIGGTADPESFVYAIEQLREFRWQHATNDEEAIPYINNVADAHERESAKLQNDADLLRAMLSQERAEKQSHMAENAKLRELVRDMYKAFMHGNCYRWCEFREPCNYISDGRCQWYDRMRELGVSE